MSTPVWAHVPRSHRQVTKAPAHMLVAHACRLLPFKNVEYTVGAAEALSFFLRLSPPVLCWSVELKAIVSDALELATHDEESLNTMLPSSRCASSACACTSQGQICTCMCAHRCEKIWRGRSVCSFVITQV